jgi:oxygen-independent coproporphyrinogen-3 oxidase
MGATYSQNAKTLPEYYDAVRQGQFPVVRGLALGRDDLVRRAVIMALMCQGRVDFESIAMSHLIPFQDYFANELQQLQPMVEGGLVEVDADGIQVTASGWYFVRGVAAVFDRYLRTDLTRERFSRIV